MPCQVFYDDDFDPGFLCSTEPTCSFGRCSESGQGKPVVALCDFPIGNGATCDAGLCALHRKGGRVGPDQDRCPRHRWWKGSKLAAALVQP